MRENKVIYGLIGYGGMGRWHTEILSNVPEIEIGGIYDIKEEKRIEAKEKGFSVYGSEEEMLSDPDIDVVLIATPNDCHKPIAIRAMHAGKNVISGTFRFLWQHFPSPEDQKMTESPVSLISRFSTHA